MSLKFESNFHLYLQVNKGNMNKMKQYTSSISFCRVDDHWPMT